MYKEHMKLAQDAVYIYKKFNLLSGLNGIIEREAIGNGYILFKLKSHFLNYTFASINTDPRGWVGDSAITYCTDNDISLYIDSELVVIDISDDKIFIENIQRYTEEMYFQDSTIYSTEQMKSLVIASELIFYIEEQKEKIQYKEKCMFCFTLSYKMIPVIAKLLRYKEHGVIK